jgi:K+-transporting ATPase ATPase C chain
MIHPHPKARFAPFVRLAVLAAALAYAGSAGAADPTLLRINSFPNAKALPLQVGIAKGFFAHRDLKAELELTESSQAQRDGLAAGKFQIAQSAIDNAVAMIETAKQDVIIARDGKNVGSRIIGQAFTGPGYFHSRPSAAGNGYDAANSGGTNLGPTNQKLINRVRQDTAALQGENPGKPVPVDLITTSASGLDPEISPAAADYQTARVARTRGMNEDEVRHFVLKHTERRQLGFLGESRVNVLELNLDLDSLHPLQPPVH